MKWHGLPPRPDHACARWLDAERRWCARADLAGRWQVGWLCTGHAPADVSRRIEAAS